MQTEVHRTWRPLYRRQLQNAKPLTGFEDSGVTTLPPVATGNNRADAGNSPETTSLSPASPEYGGCGEISLDMYSYCINNIHKLRDYRKLLYKY